MSWTEITILVDKAKTGDRDAYGELVTRFQSSVYAMALARVREPHEAQELAQEVFVHAMRKLPQLRDARCFAGWLRRITARMAINRLTRKGPMFGTDPEILNSVAGGSNDPADNLELSESKSQLHDALTKLKPEDRATLDAFYLRSRSLKQMAREFEAPVGTIKRRLFVARQRLKNVLVEAGFGNDDAGFGEPSEDMPRKRNKRELVTA